MSSIDLVVLGIVLEKPQSAYDIQKDVEYHNLSKWTKISVSSIYRKVLQLKEKGYLESDIVKGDKFADKAIYSITEKGKEYFEKLMFTYASQDVPLLFDFNVVIANLNKVSSNEAIKLIAQLRESIKIESGILEVVVELGLNYACLGEYATIPLVGRTIFEQQKLLYNSLLQWLDSFEAQMSKE